MLKWNADVRGNDEKIRGSRTGTRGGDGTAGKIVKIYSEAEAATSTIRAINCRNNDL